MPIDRFDYNSNLTTEQRLAVEAVRQGYKDLNSLLARYVHINSNQEQALVNLEQSAMWAIKGITHG